MNNSSDNIIVLHECPLYVDILNMTEKIFAHSEIRRLISCKTYTWVSCRIQRNSHYTVKSLRRYYISFLDIFIRIDVAVRSTSIFDKVLLLIKYYFQLNKCTSLDNMDSLKAFWYYINIKKSFLYRLRILNVFVSRNKQKINRYG